MKHSARFAHSVALVLLCSLLTSACTVPVDRSPRETPGAVLGDRPSDIPLTASPAVTPTATLEILFSGAAVFDAELGVPFYLAAGQRAVIPSEGLEITYVRIVEDTRCPGGVDCESRGELLIEYEVLKNGRRLGLFELGSNSTGRVIDNYVVNVWDYAGRTVMVRPYVEELPRATSADSPHNCVQGSGSFSSYVSPTGTAAETHIVGVYETGRWPSVANIYVEREDVPLTLVLSAYEPTVWRIHPAGGVLIEQIILNGTGQHQATGVDTVPVLDRSGGHGEGSIISTAYAWGSEKAQTLAAEVEAITGRPVTAFYGCYEASEFTIP